MKKYLAIGCLVLGCGSGGGATPIGTAGIESSGSAGAIAGAGTGAGPNGGASAGPQSGGAGASSVAPHVVLPCDKLGAKGAWEDVTPPGLNLSASFKTNAGDNYGAHSVGVDPKNSANVYLGTSAQGIFKSTDCGATWVHINTGRNGDKLDGGRQWVFVIDPVNPEIIYTNSGYSQDNAWKSTNGGVDWDPLVSAEYIRALQFNGFVHWIALDPTNHDHLLVTPHFSCEVGAVNGLPKSPNCMLETMDAGKTWKILEGTPQVMENGGPWMVDSKTWFVSSAFDGLSRTTDAGASWSHAFSTGYASVGDVKLSNGKRYDGGVFNVIVSSDDGASWAALPNSPGAQFVAGDSNTLYTVRDLDYYTTSVTDLTNWQHLPSPPLAQGVSAWSMKYDPDHHILYSVYSTSGFWRLVLK
ncbi:MAG: hypothetical protein ABIQ16_20355 [Polyangiaceae bacterium]